MTGYRQNSSSVSEAPVKPTVADRMKGVPRVTVAQSSAAWLERVKSLELPLVTKQAAMIPTRYLGPWAKALFGQSSARGAIKAKCYDCVAYENVAEHVGSCTSRNCPLWAYRPHQAKRSGNGA